MTKGTKSILFILIALSVAYTVFVCMFYEPEEQTLLTSLPLIIFAIAFAFIHGYYFYIKKARKEIGELKKEILIKDELAKSIKDHNEIFLKSLPVGVLIYDEDYQVTYANKHAELLLKIKSLIGKPLESINESLKQNVINRTSYDVDIFNRHIYINVNSESRIIYLFDRTKSNDVYKTYDKSRPSIMTISLDNVKVLDDYDLQEKTKILSKYYSVIENWRYKFNIYQVSNESDKLIFLFDKSTLEELKKDDFSVLKQIYDLSNNTKTDISLSIGVGTGSSDFNVLGLCSDKALELAQDRGGAQAVIYDGETYRTYQGIGNVVEKRSRISTRIYSSKLAELIKSSSSVLIMPHIDTDADAFASSYATYLIAQALNTPAKILINPDRIDTTVRRIIAASQSEYITLGDALINEKDVKTFMAGKPLIILVDHHEKKLSTSQVPYKHQGNVTVIDHHRLTDALEFNPNIELIDHNASSTVELVSEIMDVLPIEIDIASFVSTIMYVGMIIDTNDFRIHVSENTFKAASFLMSFGADASKAKLYLRESIEEKAKRASILKKAEIVSNHYALVKLDGLNIKKEDLAKAAEALLDTEGIVASFALGYLDNSTVGVSARSNGNFNVHLEMERLGGGGHYNMGAAQVQGMKIDDVYKEVYVNLLATIEGGDSIMKVILIEDVNKKGKKGDIIEVNPGYGNFLMTKKLAVEANDDNLAALNLAKQNKAKQDQEELDVAKKTKEIIESKKITIKVKLGENGKFFGSISNKHVSEALLKEQKIDVDKRKILLNDKIDSIGTYECSIKLHKDVTATLKFDVVEE